MDSYWKLAEKGGNMMQTEPEKTGAQRKAMKNETNHVTLPSS